ncbi:spermidine synthase [Aquincola sp. J276]|uniref:spermidine synthase n=1 Tax=Aquincola sp. J276 TaxID=2898432 RepID=UPI0021516500|nr:spermidine synthase [Aquincola sp. J276]MCR5869243.1 spermidine synthase [Aquincola sp. J276]
MSRQAAVLEVPALAGTGLRWRLALALMLGSGASALGLQMVWTQQAALWLGHESAAVLAVVAAFFGGLALGALALGGRILRSRRPALWYAGCEAVIGGWSLLLALLMAPAASAMLAAAGPQPSAAWQWAVAFGGCFVLLLPATAAMGATLPAMERVLAPLREGPGARAGWIAALYAGNTFGAVLGVLAVAFWAVPALGLLRSAALCAGLNLLCAALAWTVFDQRAAAPASAGSAAAARPEARRLQWLLAATGLLGIGYEVLAVRVISQVTENTVYTFAMLLAVYLVGSAVGAAAYGRWRRSGPAQDALLRGRLLGALAATCLLGTGALYGAPGLHAAVLAALQGTAGSMAAALVAEAVLALAAFGPPTLVMGALFSHLGTEAGRLGIGFGRSLGINTLGAAAAPLLLGVLAVPALGAKATLLLLAAAYLALAGRAAWSAAWGWVLLCAGLLVALAAPPLRFVQVPEGGRIVQLAEGPMAVVSVVEDAAGVARLRINNRQQEGSSDSLAADARQALLPLLLHPAPRQALFLGLGTGVTAGSAAQDAGLQVRAVELLPEVIDAAGEFGRRVFGQATPPRLQSVAADARRFVRTDGGAYDLIVADNFHPARSGSGALYTVEHFAAVQARLAPGGLFCQWLPLHQLDLPTLRSIVRSFHAVYPGGWMLLATHSLDTPVVGLLARQGGGGFGVAQVQARMAQAALPAAPAAFGLPDAWSVLGSFVAGPAALGAWSAGAPLNTDDHPVVAYAAPRITYAPDSRPAQRLLALLQALDAQPQEVLGSAAPATDAARLAAYWRARDGFLQAGQGVRPSADVRQMLDQVREPLLSVLRTSPDFEPARLPLQRMADALAATDAQAARQLRDELQATWQGR